MTTWRSTTQATAWHRLCRGIRRIVSQPRGIVIVVVDLTATFVREVRRRYRQALVGQHLAQLGNLVAQLALLCRIAAKSLDGDRQFRTQRLHFRRGRDRGRRPCILVVLRRENQAGCERRRGKRRCRARFLIMGC